MFNWVLYGGPVTHRKEGRLIRRRAGRTTGRHTGSEGGSGTGAEPTTETDDDDSLHSQKFYPRGSNLCIRSLAAPRKEERGGSGVVSRDLPGDACRRGRGAERRGDTERKLHPETPSAARTRPVGRPSPAAHPSFRPSVRQPEILVRAAPSRGTDRAGTASLARRGVNLACERATDPAPSLPPSFRPSQISVCRFPWRRPGAPLTTPLLKNSEAS